MSASVRSMTGYGRGEHIAEERKFTVEMKSVNHRYNDMTIKLPRSLAGLEDKIKKRIMHEVFRGKTDVYISFETFSAADVEVKLNEALAAAYIEKLKLIEEKFGIYSENKLELAAKFPDVITVEKAQQEEEVIWEALVPALDEAVEKFVAMRTIEGENLKKDFRFIMKQRGGRMAKGRLLGVQFDTLFTDDLYFKISRHAIEMAHQIRDIFVSAGYPLLFDSPTNQQYPIMSDDELAILGKSFGYEYWERVDETHSGVRFCASWATKQEHVDALRAAVNALKK